MAIAEEKIISKETDHTAPAGENGRRSASIPAVSSSVELAPFNGSAGVLELESLSRSATGDTEQRLGLRGWLRALNVGRVLGLLSLYLFLDSYDVRADFNRRMSSRRREE